MYFALFVNTMKPMEFEIPCVKKTQKRHLIVLSPSR